MTLHSPVYFVFYAWTHKKSWNYYLDIFSWQECYLTSFSLLGVIASLNERQIQKQKQSTIHQNKGSNLWLCMPAAVTHL